MAPASSPIVHRASQASRHSVPIVHGAETDPLNTKGSVFQWVVGCVFLFIVAIIWTFSSVLIQYIFDDLAFEAPFFLTAFGMSLFSVNLPIYYVTKVLWPRLQGADASSSSSSDLPYQLKDGAGTPVAASSHSKPLLKQTAIAGAIVAPLWFSANFTYNESLSLTSVTSSTILSATSTVFTLLFGVWVLKERFSWAKLLGVVLCMAGNISTLANDSSSGQADYLWGDLVALLGAVLYGVYTTAIRQLIPDRSGISVSLFFGFLGLFSFCGLALFVVVFHATGVESLRNLTPKIVGLLFVQGLLNNVLADYLWAVAILYTSTTTATVGLSLTVPMAILSDWWVHDMAPTYVTVLSSVLVLAGFVVISLSTRKDQLEQVARERRAADGAVPLTPVEPSTAYQELGK
ncbi:hypothetical protein PybrP1_002907 [[Pythium] brassicae (nom. inval.)]|nr:hypothetical protein PybrP1_002907 [[Pythium] brassicae (nom. inval.)]